MMRFVCRAKIHRATVTGKSLEYEGSITIDGRLLELADILPGERVQVLNLSNGARVETYVIEGEPGSGQIVMNGPAARWAEPGDLVIVIAYALVEEEEARRLRPRVVRVDSRNRPVNPEGAGG